MLKDDDIKSVINNPWVTPGDIEELIVIVENTEGIQSPWIQALLTIEGAMVLAEYIATKGD